MGEVYRARDTNLGRDVAVKVLPEEFSENRDRLARFEQEARAASALNHPNILTVYDLGTAQGRSFIAMEVVEGKSLRELLESGPLPQRKGLDLAAQIADGLAKAHAAGIVHRDLKPENIMVSKDGFAKILDFGLAKLTQPAEQDVSDIPTAAPATTPGMIMGTVGYMSPEQAAGQAVDYRSDQFSFGAIGYEMATGRKAFARNTAAETLAAIIREEPEAVADINPRVPSPVRWIVERCLSKDPEDRYASTKDLARDLKSIRDHLSDVSTSSTGGMRAVAKPRSRIRLLTAALVAAILLIPVAAFVGMRSSRPSKADFRRITFRRGIVRSARFVPGAPAVLFGATWDGEPYRVFSTRPGSPESSAVALPDADLLSVSKGGELAISVHRHSIGGFMLSGMLARSPLSGGTPREVLKDVQSADWSPDGLQLAIVRAVEGKHRLEYPIGKVLYETGGWISHARVSPGGDLLAFCDHPVQGDDAGSVAVVDRSGTKKVLSSGWYALQGLSWKADGNEIWFTATREGSARAIHAVTLSGSERLVAATPGTMTLMDISADGRALVSRDDWRTGLMGLFPGDKRERSMSWLDWTVVRDLSADGRKISFDESGEGSSPKGDVYLRATDGSPAVKLGEGSAGEISRDGNWLISISPDYSHVVLLPTGPGEPRPLPAPGFTMSAAGFVPDGKGVVLLGHAKGQGARIYLQSVRDGKTRPISPEGIQTLARVSPDGQWVATRGSEQHVDLYSVNGGPARTVPETDENDFPTVWSSDGRSILMYRRGEVPCKAYWVDVASGRRVLWKTIDPDDPAGLDAISPLYATPDGKSYIYGFTRILSDLYLVTGLK
jgi:Tol biopolymer transport system component/predicted Ser/Thr protein kinase